MNLTIEIPDELISQYMESLIEINQLKFRPEDQDEKGVLPAIKQLYTMGEVERAVRDVLSNTIKHAEHCKAEKVKAARIGEVRVFVQETK